MANTAQSEAARWLARADEAAGDKDVPPEDVLVLYRKALSLDPTLVEGWADYGASLGWLGRYDEAVAALDRGLAIEPRHRRCLVFRGDAQKRKGDLPAALATYRLVTSTYPDDAHAWVQYGAALDLAGRLDEALAAMEQALKARPGYLDAIKGKANVELHMGRMPASGIPLDISPGQLMRGILQAQVADVLEDMKAAAAERAAETAGRPPAAEEPATPDACYARAQALLRAGDHAKALPYLEKVLELAPRHLGALDAVVATLGKLGRAADALAWCEKWIAHPLLKDKDRARAFCAKGVCLREMKDFVKALAAIDKALVLDPGNVAIAKERAGTVAAARGAHGAITPTPAPRPAVPNGAQVFSMAVGPEEEDPVGAIRQRMDEIAALPGRSPPRRSMGGPDPGKLRALMTEAVHLNEARRFADALAKLAEAEQLDSQIADLHLAKGMNLRGLGRWEDSVAALQRAVELDPALRNAWFYLADSLDNLNRLDHAVACYDRAVALDPRDVDAWTDRGHVLHRLGRTLDAIESWKRALALDPGCALAWLNRGVAEVALGQPGPAVLSLERFLALAPPGPLADHVDHARALIAECRQRLAGSGGASPIQELFNRARQADREGRRGDAIAGYREVVAKDPTCFPAWMNLGICLEELEMHAEALPCYENALAVNAKEAVIWGQKGVCLDRLGRPDEALVALDKCTALAPGKPFGWLHKARIHLAQRRPTEAVAAASRALDLNPGDASIWRLEADALEQLGRLPECLAALDRYAQLVPADLRINDRRLQLKRRIAAGDS